MSVTGQVNPLMEVTRLVLLDDRSVTDRSVTDGECVGEKVVKLAGMEGTQADSSRAGKHLVFATCSPKSKAKGMQKRHK